MIIALEGIDASGKETQSQMLVDRLRKAGLKADRFDFPRYESPMGQQIHGLLTGQWEIEDPTTRALVLQAMMTGNRYEHYDYLRAWADDPNAVLVLDRYYASGVVYGSCDGIDRSLLLQMHRALPQPDIWILVDIPAEESVRRRPNRQDEYEAREGFMHKVRDAYLELFAWGGIWKIVDGMGTSDEIHERIWRALEYVRPSMVSNES